MNALEKEVLSQIGESVTSPDVFTDDSSGMAQIRTSINDAIAEICMVKGTYRRKYYLPLYEDRGLYRMGWTSDYFGYVVQAWDRSRHYRLEQTDPLLLADMDTCWLKRQGDPTHYYHVGYDTIGIWRKPSATGRVIELDCVCIPAPYATDTDRIKIRANFERATVSLALSEFYASRGDAKRATEHLNEYVEIASLQSLQPVMQDRLFRFGGNNGYVG